MVVPTYSVHSVDGVTPGLVTLGYFPQKVRKWERNTTLFICSRVPFGRWVLEQLVAGLHVSGICGSGMGTQPLTWGCQSSLHLSGLGGLGAEDAGEEMPQGRSCLFFLQSLSAETRILAVVALPPGAPPRSSPGRVLGASGFGKNAPRVTLCLSHLPKWRVLGRSLHLCEPEWLPPTSPQIFTEHRSRHQK